MYHTNAFGQRISIMPRLRYAKKPEGEEGGGGEPKDGDEVELDGEKFKFPVATAVADMTTEQAAEYWRHEAKKQQKKKADLPSDYAQFKADSEKLAKLEAEKLPEQERLLNEARDKARREGEVIGAERYLKEAVKGRFQAITGKKDEDVDTAFAHVDALSFVDDKGELDTEAIKKFAATFGTGSGAGTDPVRDALQRRTPSAGSGGATSIAERRQATRDRMSKKTNQTNS